MKKKDLLVPTKILGDDSMEISKIKIFINGLNNQRWLSINSVRKSIDSEIKMFRPVDQWMLLSFIVVAGSVMDLPAATPRVHNPTA